MSTTRLTVEVAVTMPNVGTLAEGLSWLSSLPTTSPERLECEAFIYMMLARSCWREADHMRAIGRRHPRKTAGQ